MRGRSSPGHPERSEGPCMFGVGQIGPVVRRRGRGPAGPIPAEAPRTTAPEEPARTAVGADRSRAWDAPGCRPARARTGDAAPQRRIRKTGRARGIVAFGSRDGGKDDGDGGGPRGGFRGDRRGPGRAGGGDPAGGGRGPLRQRRAGHDGAGAAAGRRVPQRWWGWRRPAALEQAVAVAVAEAEAPVGDRQPRAGARLRPRRGQTGQDRSDRRGDAGPLWRGRAAGAPPGLPGRGGAGAARPWSCAGARSATGGWPTASAGRSADPAVHPFLDRAIAAATEELADLDAAIAARVAAEPPWQASERMLESVPGVGPIVAATLVAELPELGTLGAKQVAALAGLAPRTRESGKRRGAATIGGGRRGVRCALYLAAVTGIRWNPTIADLRRAPCGRRQTEEARLGRRRPQAAQHPQRHGPRRVPLGSASD